MNLQKKSRNYGIALVSKRKITLDFIYLKETKSKCWKIFDQKVIPKVFRNNQCKWISLTQGITGIDFSYSPKFIGQCK